MQLVRASRTTDLMAIQNDVGEDLAGTLADDLQLHTVAVAFLSSEQNFTLK